MKYKNVSKKDLLVVGIGLVKSGAIRNMPVGFHNANFLPVEIIKEIKEEKKCIDKNIQK